MQGIDNSLAINSFSARDLQLNKKAKNDEILKEQTDSFEAIFLKMLLDKALETDDENSLFPKSAGSDIYKSMYNDALSKDMSGSFGFSQMLFDFLKQNS